ncbi:TolB family protein, partial [Xylanibacter caecicola]
MALTLSAGSAGAQDNTVNIGKSNIRLASDRMTPEALWAMGRIASAEASPDGKQIVYQVGYYSVKENKSHQVICIINSNGKNNRRLTTVAASETDPTWINGGKNIAYLYKGQIWMMNPDGTERRQLTKSAADIEGFKFSPDGKKVILIKSMPFNEIIKKNPDDLPKATGRVVTDLMYRHWDHYVESIQHPFVADVTAEGIVNGEDILAGEPFECPMEPFGGIEQLAWSTDSKAVAYTC